MDKLLKSPNSPNTVFVSLTAVSLTAIAEELDPRAVGRVSTVLRGTPIVVISKTANCNPIDVKLV